MSATDAQRLANRKPIPKPVPAYLPSSDASPLKVNRELYDKFREAPRVLVEEFTLPIRSGRAWEVPVGSIVKISTPEGPQVGMNKTESWSMSEGQMASCCREVRGRYENDMKQLHLPHC
jgi:hypothetical protein